MTFDLTGLSEFFPEPPLEAKPEPDKDFVDDGIPPWEGDDRFGRTDK